MRTLNQTITILTAEQIKQFNCKSNEKENCKKETLFRREKITEKIYNDRSFCKFIGENPFDWILSVCRSLLCRSFVGWNTHIPYICVFVSNVVHSLCWISVCDYFLFVCILWWCFGALHRLHAGMYWTRSTISSVYLILFFCLNFFIIHLLLFREFVYVLFSNYLPFVLVMSDFIHLILLIPIPLSKWKKVTAIF